MPLSWIGSLILSGCHFSPNCAVESMQCPKYNFCGNWQVYSKKYKRAKDLGLHTYTHTKKKKTIRRRTEEHRVLTSLDFKSYYKVRVIKTIWYWNESRQIGNGSE